MSNQWENHYTRDRSVLSYPDENLVRLVRKTLLNDSSIVDETALDLGCGTGRHLALLRECGFNRILGFDRSHNALEHCAMYDFAGRVCADNSSIPLRDETVACLIAWGSLHYAPDLECAAMISEISRVLRPGGHLFATLRTTRDTYLRRGRHIGHNTWETELSDLAGQVVSFFDYEDVLSLFSGYSSVAVGLMERTPMGDISKIISHWIIDATR